MKTLALALYAEGRADERFLPILVRRTAESLLARQSTQVVDVFGPLLVNHDIDVRFPIRSERLLEASRRAYGYHLLVIHADADYPEPDRALRERIQPGLEAIGEAAKSDTRLNDRCVALIPVQMTEAWMLADPQALIQVIGATRTAEEMGIPTRAVQVESLPNPKQTLQQSIQQAISDRPRRRRRIQLSEIHEPLARQISLERLQGVPAYQTFIRDLTVALKDLHFLE